jgi:mannose-6-phosphate isomerase
MFVLHIHPFRLEASLHETIWGGRRLEEIGWKTLPPGEIPIGESWETEISTRVQNSQYTGRTLGELVKELDADLLGADSIAIFGHRFPLLAKFIDANAKLSVQVHPDDHYATRKEGGKLGKTEFWYILDAAPGATIVHGFEATSTREKVRQAIEEVRLEELVHEEPVTPGDVIFVPAGTVHAIGSGVLLYELQEYSDVTYRMYDYGRLDAQGRPRELHIERSLDVARFEPSARIKMQPVVLAETAEYLDRCLVACRYFVTREIVLRAHTQIEDRTGGSCLILSSLGADLSVRYGEDLEASERLLRGQTMVLPAALGDYRIEGEGAFLLSYVPAPGDRAWQLWDGRNC